MDAMAVLNTLKSIWMMLLLWLNSTIISRTMVSAIYMIASTEIPRLMLFIAVQTALRHWAYYDALERVRRQNRDKRLV